MSRTLMLRYIEQDGVPVPEPDLLAWGQWMQTAERHVAETWLGDGVLRVSTVFLGLDHAMPGDQTPCLYETMVFAPAFPAWDEVCARYASREAALAGHRWMVRHIRQDLDRARPC